MMAYQQSSLEITLYTVQRSVNLNTDLQAVATLIFFDKTQPIVDPNRQPV